MERWNRKQQEEQTAETKLNIIPGLPGDVALHILALLPRALYSRFSLVCRSWRDALLLPDGPVMALRKRLNISDTWVVFVSLQAKRIGFLFVDPACHGCFWKVDALIDQFEVPVPRLVQGLIQPPMAVRHEIFIPLPYCDTISLLQVSNPMEWDKRMELHCFDARTMHWKVPVCLHPPDVFILGYATAAVDECVYLAGGISISSEGPKVSKRVQILNTTTKTWEVLPDMQEGRISASAAFLQGRFCIVGGNSVHSGEIWDPSSRKWTSIPELWPASIFGENTNEACVAPVKGRLYALRCEKHDDVQELMYYEDASKLWVSMGKFCFPALVEGDRGAFRLCEKEKGHYQMVGVDEELLVICRAEPPVDRKYSKCLTFLAILSMKPTLCKPITWRVWPLLYPVTVYTKPLIIHV